MTTLQRLLLSSTALALITQGISTSAAAKQPCADFNLDEQINSLDLTTWKNSYAADGGADADGDGYSDGADLLAWQRQLNSALPVTVHAPEPATILVWSGLAASVGLVIVRRRRAS